MKANLIKTTRDRDLIEAHPGDRKDDSKKDRIVVDLASFIPDLEDLVAHVVSDLTPVTMIPTPSLSKGPMDRTAGTILTWDRDKGLMDLEVGVESTILTRNRSKGLMDEEETKSTVSIPYQDKGLMGLEEE